MKVPFVDLRAQYASIKAEIDHAVHTVFESGRFVGGPELELFQDEYASYCGVPFAVGCGSGTAALQLALLAAGVGRGDEVITVANTFAATAEAIVHVGGIPVFVDVEELSGNIDPLLIENAISSRTKAVIPVHLHGQCASIDDVVRVARAHKLIVIEDAAQAHGAMCHGRKVGSWGDMACFSFYPGKNLGAFGEAGIITTADECLRDQLALLVSHGEKRKNEHLVVGFNHRLDAVQAAVLRVKLSYLDEWNRRRMELASFYNERLRCDSRAVLPAEVPDLSCVFHHYVVRVPRRDQVMQNMQVEGVATLVHYPVPLNKQAAFGAIARTAGPLEVTEKLSREILSLPLFPEMTESQIEVVVTSLRQAIGS